MLESNARFRLSPIRQNPFPIINPRSHSPSRSPIRNNQSGSPSRSRSPLAQNPTKTFLAYAALRPSPPAKPNSKTYMALNEFKKTFSRQRRNSSGAMTNLTRSTTKYKRSKLPVFYYLFNFITLIV